ncbi:MAG: DNA mismatch repair protein MutS [Gemmatimonadales bacterium]
MLLVLLWAVLFGRALPPVVLLLPVAVFAGFVVAAYRAERARDQARRAAAFHARGIARLDHTWHGQGISGTRWQDEHHPYAADLDLFGHGSLFEYLCEARTAAGERVLAEWLQRPAAWAEIAARQEAVRELQPRLELRESLAVLGAEVREHFDERPLVRWAEAEQPPFPGWTMPVSRALVTLFLGALLGGALGWWPGWLLLPPLAGIALVGATLRARVQATIAEVGAAARELDDLAALIERLEAERVASPRLVEIRTRLMAGSHPASRQIWRLRRLIGLLDSRGNQLIMLVLPLLLWTTQVACAIGRWRREIGPSVRDWIDATGEFEALASLAGHAFEHPDAAWPEFKDGAGFRATGIGHPLLAGGGVRNDVTLGGTQQLLVVSGSNMSGKSTLLRAVGNAVVMAQAGAPAHATSLVLEPLAVGASISTHDSLLEGSSRFYAEITRLRQVHDLAGGERTLLFLLDELLSGTNSHDRRIGAEAIVQSLVDRGAIGLLTTHDLALARIAEALAPRAANIHFEDQLVEGRISFDYRIRPGVVERSNALELMRSVGLQV